MSQNSGVRLPGEIIYKGLRLGGIFTPDTVDRASELRLYPSDVMIVGYPKTGNYRVTVFLEDPNTKI